MTDDRFFVTVHERNHGATQIGGARRQRGFGSMANYLLIFMHADVPEIAFQAEDDGEAREIALTELLLHKHIGALFDCRAMLRRDDGSDVWQPDLVANLIS